MVTGYNLTNNLCRKAIAILVLGVSKIKNTIPFPFAIGV